MRNIFLYFENTKNNFKIIKYIYFMFSFISLSLSLNMFLSMLNLFLISEDAN